MATTTKELTEGRYEVLRVPCGRVYEWGPGGVLVGCDCERLMNVEENAATCPRCGANYTGVLAGQHRELSDEGARPEYREHLFSGLFSGLMNANFLLAGTVSTNPIPFILATWVVLAWRVAGYWGLDRWALPLIGVPGAQGTLFRGRHTEDTDSRT